MSRMYVIVCTWRARLSGGSCLRQRWGHINALLEGLASSWQNKVWHERQRVARILVVWVGRDSTTSHGLIVSCVGSNPRCVNHEGGPGNWQRSEILHGTHAMRPGSIVKPVVSIIMLLVELRAGIGWDIKNPKQGKKSARPVR